MQGKGLTTLQNEIGNIKNPYSSMDLTNFHCLKKCIPVNNTVEIDKGGIAVEQSYEYVFPKIFKRFRESLPASVDNDSIKNVVDWCLERINSNFEDKAEILLDEDVVKIGFGKPIHIFEQGEGEFINVYSKDAMGITWVFDSETGENIAT